MKTSKDPRHIRRVNAVKSLFSYSFNQEQGLESDLGQKVVNEIEQIDSVISKCAPEWPLNQINKLDLAVLRLAIYELIHKDQTPPKVIIDEAIEIGKQFGSSSSGSFINGVLGAALEITDRLEDIEETNKLLKENE